MAAPVLPATCRWVTTVREATEKVTAGYIPLLLPAEAARAARWAEVMRWYDPPGSRPTGTLVGDGSAVVVSTTSAEAIGQLTSAALGRPHHHIDTLTDTRLLPTERSVLIVAPATDATRSALTPALDLWDESDTQVGLLTGRDPAGMVFSLAKILAAQASIRATHELAGQSVVLDGRGGRARRIDDTTQLPIEDALVGDWHTMVIDADGDASHALNAHLVLCGLTSAHEADLDGRPIPGGCVEHRCKLAPGMTNPLHGHSLRAAVLSLLVPNAVAIGRGERYPSEVCLALDALDGFPAAVLGLARGDTPTSSLEAAVVARLLHAGTPLGQAARDLNLGLMQQGLPYAALLLGDPEQAPPAAEDAVVPSVDIPDGITLPLIVNGQQRAIPALLVRGRALLADQVPDARVEDGTEPTADLISQLRSWHSRLVEAELVEAAMASAESSLGPFLPRCLEPMRAARAEAMNLVASTVGHLERLQAHRETGPPADPNPELTVLAERWASALADLLDSTSATITDALTAALAAHHHVGRSAVAGPCNQCGALVQRHTYASPLPVGNRTDLHCPRCGTISSHPEGGAAVMLDAPSRLQVGEPATVTAVLDRVRGATGLLYVQLKPSILSSYVDDSYCHLVDDATVAVTLEVPPNATPDLHRIWALYACRFQLAIAQARIPVVPASAPNTSVATTDGARNRPGGNPSPTSTQ